MFTGSKPVIYAHRGDWLFSGAPQNSLDALSMAIDSKFGIETDFRMDELGLSLGHDNLDIELREAIPLLAHAGCPLALNIKQDGLSGEIAKAFDFARKSNSFVFDCSIPEAIKYRNLNIPIALRLSEFERTLPWNSEFIWLDAFYSDWWLEDKKVIDLMRLNKVIVVSPELHNRDHKYVWDWLMGNHKEYEFQFGICTDFPHEFEKLFDV